MHKDRLIPIDVAFKFIFSDEGIELIGFCNHLLPVEACDVKSCDPVDNETFCQHESDAGGSACD